MYSPPGKKLDKNAFSRQIRNNVYVYSSSNNNNNNNNNNNLSKSGPSTIEDQFRQELNKNGRAEGEGRPRLNVFSLPHTGGKRQGKAMNYYRLWIYTCNAVLFISVLGFVIVAGRVVLIDPRRTLIPGLTLHEPSLLYAYLALLTQSGLLQLLGCIGAHKLNERLLNMYWLLLLFLLFGDAFIGVVWVFRFEKMYTDLKPILRQRLQMEYGVNEEFTNVWDSIQHDFSCCGVEGPQDFNEINFARKKDNATGESRHNIRIYDESDKNRVIVNRTANLNLRDQTKGYAIVTTSEESLTDDAKNVDGPTNSYFSTLVTMSSTSSDPFVKDSYAKYIRNVPESCCRVLTEDIPDENTVEKHEEPQSKPTAIRQRLEKKKNRHQENKVAKRSASDYIRLYESSRHATNPLHETTCRGNNCKNPTKRHTFDNKLQFRSSHVRHDSPYRNTHHYSASANTLVTNDTRERKPIPKYSTGNFRIMDTCANINGHPVGTIYGMSETLHFSIGCEVKLKKWLRDSAHVLGVLGYCVIAFLKLCFLGILRYEIREMIQKIKMLQSEQQPPILLLSAESPDDNPEVNSPTSGHNLCNHMDNAMLMSNVNKTQNAISKDAVKENPDRLRANSLGNAFLLFQPHDSGQTTPVHQIKTSQMSQKNHRLYNNILGGDAGNDSDTNSHCALLIDGEEAPPKKHARVSSNGNNNYESHELQDLLVRHSAQI